MHISIYMSNISLFNSYLNLQEFEMVSKRVGFVIATVFVITLQFITGSFLSKGSFLFNLGRNKSILALINIKFEIKFLWFFKL